MLGEAPKNSFADELHTSNEAGADLLASMVRLSIFQQGQMPPAEMFEWYVLNLAYRMVDAEHKYVYKLEGADEVLLEELQDEMKGVQLLLGKQKMFGLQHKIEDIHRVRALHLPQ